VSRTKRIITVETSAEETKIKEIAVLSVYPSRLMYIGAISGKRYEWADSGVTVLVLAEDVPSLLEKRIGSKSCCGALNENGNKVFELTDLTGGNNA
jgi:hypothetical protein